MEDINRTLGLHYDIYIDPTQAGCPTEFDENWFTKKLDSHLQFSTPNCRSDSKPKYFSPDIERNHVLSNLRFIIPINFMPLSHPQKSFPGVQKRPTEGIEHLHQQKPESSSEESQMEDSVSHDVDDTDGHQKTSIGICESKRFKKESLKNVMKRNEKSLEFWKEYEKYMNLDWRTVSKGHFLELSKTSLISSSILQQLIARKQNISDLEVLAIDSVLDLIFDQFGCHILRKLLKRSRKVATTISGLIQGDRFIQLSTQQFASKVLQTAAELDEEIKNSCLDKMIEHWDNLKWSISANYLFKVVLYRTSNTDPRFSRVSSFIMDRCDKIFNDKYDKRFLVYFLDVCSRKQLALLYRKSSIEKLILSKGTDRYVISSFLAFVQRRYKKAEDFLIDTLLDPSRKDNSILKRLTGQISKKLRASVSNQLALLLNDSTSM